MRRGLPLLEKLGDPLTARLPVGRLGRDVLGLLDDPLFDLAGLGTGVLTGGLDFLAPGVDRSGQCLKPPAQAIEVAERVGVGHGLQQALHGGLRLGGCHVGRRDALLDQRHLGLE